MGGGLKALYALLVSLALLSTLCAADAVSDLQKKGRAALDAQIAKSTTCTKEKLQVRREWYVYLSRYLGITDVYVQGRYQRCRQESIHCCCSV